MKDTIRILKRFVRSKLLYGSETLTAKIYLRKKIDLAEMLRLTRLLTIPGIEKGNNDEIFRRGVVRGE